MNKRKLQVWLPLLFGVVMALGVVTGFQLAGTSAMGGIAVNKNRSSVQELLDLLEYKYVDTLSLDSLENDGIEAIISHLDPHTVYIPKQQLSEANADLQGGFSGIGVEYQMINDTVNVVYVVENGPSAAAGMQVGDQILKVNDSLVAGKKIQGTDLRKLLRGEYHTKVGVTVLRNNQPMKLTITRGNIPLLSLDAAYMAAPEVGYIRLNKFAETTYREFMDAATSLQKQGMKKMILDLRGNTGGILTEATNIADELLTDGLVIVSTKGSHVKSKEIKSIKPGIFEEGKLVVLVDEFSASASEVLAGALQDNDRCTVIGRRSFGKGLVQEQFDLANGGAVRITVARYYTPTGRSIQKPYNGNREDYLDEVLDRHRHIDSSSPISKEVYTTAKGKKLYGGGGITPDIIVAFDSSQVPASASALFNYALLNEYGFLLFKNNQKNIRSYSTINDYIRQYNLPANAWTGLLDEAQKDSIKFGSIPESSKNEIELRLKAHVARYLWRSSGYYQILQPTDRTLLQAIEFIQKK